MALSHEQLRRYARNIVLEQVGRSGQEKLLDSRVLVVGAGGLGAPVISYLAAAGIGTIGVIDDDKVELSNLQRQVIHETGDIGRPKVESARDRVYDINPGVVFEPYNLRITAANAAHIIDTYDIVVDGSDNFDTRFAVAEQCHITRKPLISGAIQGFSGQISTFKPYLGQPYPCYRCLVPEAPICVASCADSGVIGALPGIIGSMQALEVIKEILAIGESLAGQLLIYDALSTSSRKVQLPADPQCLHCGKEAKRAAAPAA